MKTSAITMVIGLALAAGAAAQGSTSSKRSPEASSKSPLSQIRSLANELQGHADKLGDMMTIYHSLLEQRPDRNGGSPEQKKAHDEQLAKWSAAVARHVTRIEAERASVIDVMQRLDQAIKGQTLPTALAKDVANARNEATAQRSAAEHAIKAKPKDTSKAAKPAPRNDEPAPSLDDDLDL